jgi:hypothetical protein
MRFAVDTWEPGYGTSGEPDATATDLSPTDVRVDVAVEVPADRWRPIDPAPGPAPAAVLFVDGVRRIDARAWVEDDGTSAMGLFASYAAGVVCCCGEGAHLAVAQVRRDLVTTATLAGDVTTPAGTYTAVRTTAPPPRPAAQALDLALQRRLGELEMQVAMAARGTAAVEDDLVVVDGPLHGRTHLPRALGYVKTQHTEYLGGDQRPIVGRLGPGQRTPAFSVGTTWDRMSWYVRLPLAGSGAPAAPWAGVVRVECAPDITGDRLTELADLSARVLPAFASVPYKDPRAPQNLVPIGGLEALLKHRLGDRRVLQSALARAAWTSATALTTSS